MKRLFLILVGLLVTPAIAEVSPFLSLDEYAAEYTDVSDVGDVENDDTVTKTVTTPTTVQVSRQPTATSSRSVASRGTASRAVPASTTTASGRAYSSADGRVVASRNTANTSTRGTSDTARSVAGRTTATSSRTAVSPRTATSSRTATTTATRTSTASAAGRATASRTATTAQQGTASSTAGRATTAARTATAGRATTAGRAATTRAGGTATTARAGTLYNRTSVSGNTMSTSNKIGSRVPAIRVATSTKTTDIATSTASTLAEMDDLAEMTDYCKSQYAACMDDYCNVLDDNQGRCSCSANLKNYAKAEAALKTATEELQDVAQKIQYIGLTTREVETLFTETEAEMKMSSISDTSAIKTSLDKIKDMLIEVRTGTATSSETTNLSDFGFDASGLLNFSFDSTGFDLDSLLGGFGGNTSSVTNQRGEELYKTAVSRCKTAVLKSCTNSGVDANLVTNSYDLQIDKECILYERSLTDSNDQMVATIRNAKNVLQKARLMVSQQKNVYDMRGCINALDSCMQDEFVCGTDYENCLDPTGRYIVNGEIVLGSEPGHPIDPNYVYNNSVTSAGMAMSSDVCLVNLYRTWDMPNESCSIGHGNAWSADETLANYITNTVTDSAAKSVSTNMSEYLQNKIGYVDTTNSRNMGMCISVLNKCQDYTYTKKGTNNKMEYNPQNEVIKQYLARTLIQIKAKQDEILSEYADSCVSDVKSCLSQNGYSESSPSDPASNLAVNACRATIVTCMSVTGYSTETPTPSELASWACKISGGTGCVGKSVGDINITWHVETAVKGASNVVEPPMTEYEQMTAHCSQKYVENMNQMIPCQPVGIPEGYTFVGWCSNNNLTDCTSGSNVWIAATETAVKNYYAKWTCAAGYELTETDGNQTCTPKSSGTDEEGDNGQGGNGPTPTTDTCSKEKLTLCTNKDACEATDVGGHWCSNTCQNTSCTTEEGTGCTLENLDACNKDGCLALANGQKVPMWCEIAGVSKCVERACSEQVQENN